MAEDRTLWDAHERRIVYLESGMSSIQNTVTKIEADIVTNNTITSEIRDDTKEIRDLMKGARALSKILGGAAALVAAGFALYSSGLFR